MSTHMSRLEWVVDLAVVVVVAALLGGVVYGFFTSVAAGLLIGVLLGLLSGLVIGAAATVGVVRWLVVEARRPAPADVIDGEWRDATRHF